MDARRSAPHRSPPRPIVPFRRAPVSSSGRPGGVGSEARSRVSMSWPARRAPRGGALSALLLLSLPALSRAQVEDDPLVSDADLEAKPAAVNGVSEDSGGAGPRVLILPYQAIFRSADPDKTRLATDLVVKELSRPGGLEVVRGGVAKRAAAPTQDAEPANLLRAAEGHESRRDIEAAIAARRQLIAHMEAKASAIEDAEDFIRAHHELARALFWAGLDEEAEKTLDAAARMAPGFELPPDEYSRFYRSSFQAAAKKAIDDRPAEILVRSALPGAKIYLDGRETAVAPVRLEKALPGKHLLQAELEGVPTAAQVVRLEPGRNPEVTVSFGDTWGGVAVGAVADAIAENQLPATAVEKAVEAGKEAGADYVVAGGMAHDKVAAKFNVHTFVVNVASGGIMQLAPANFDLDMLTAASDVIRIVRGIERSVKNFGDAKRAVASIEGKVQRTTTVNAVDVRPDFTIRKRGASRRPNQPTVRRPIRVLKGSGTIRIKDEED